MKKIIIVCQLVFSVFVYSQNEPKLSLFSYNPLHYNPAYSGVFDGLCINTIYSSQWSGFVGAPETLFFSAHSNIFLREVGAGINITSDKIGPIQDNQIVGNFAYHIYLNDDLNLTFGMKGGVDNFVIDYTLLSIENPEEGDLAQGSISQISPIIGTGMYLSTDKAFIGISVPNLLKTQYFNEFNNSIANSKPSYYFSGGYKFEVDYNVFVTPNILTRVTSGAPINTLYAVNIDYKNQLFGSVNVQPSSSLGLFSGYRFKNNISVGYAFDYSLNQLTNYSNGCHSLYINFKLEDLFSNHTGYGTF